MVTNCTETGGGKRALKIIKKHAGVEWPVFMPTLILFFETDGGKELERLSQHVKTMKILKALMCGVGPFTSASSVLGFGIYNARYLKP